MPVAGAQVVSGDCLEILGGLPANRFDALVTDPPAGIAFMGKEWDKFGRSRMRDGEAAKAAASGRGGKTVQPFGYSSAPSLSQDQKQLAKVRGLFLDFLTPRLAECLRVCKPGAVGLVWALPRTSHWTALAIEEAGWVIQDRIAHLFGTGFPKGKHLLKPACEDWWLCRKPGPLWLGVEECRIAGVVNAGWCETKGKGSKFDGTTYANGKVTAERQEKFTAAPAGRWPANLCLSHSPGCRLVGTRRVKGSNLGTYQRTQDDAATDDGQIYGKMTPRPPGHQVNPYADADGLEEVENWECIPECPVKLLDGQAGERRTHAGTYRNATTPNANGWGTMCNGRPGRVTSTGDSGGPSRFFYCAKASKKDRGPDNKHPTVKSTALMSWLVKLACPEGGVVLDPFCGTASTGVACMRTGRQFYGVESDLESVATGRRRLVAESAALRCQGERKHGGK
jgi:DNA modification methylase